MLSRTVRYLLATLSGVLIVLSFPGFNLWVLSWFSLVPLIVAINGADWRTSLRLGFITGIIYFGGVMSWLMVLIPYSTVFWVTLGYIVLSTYLSTYVILFAVAVNMITSRWNKFTFHRGTFTYHLACSMLVALIWTGLEILRGHVASGLPWAGLAYTQWRSTPLIQISSIFGSYAVSFLIALFNGSLATLIISIENWRNTVKVIASVVGLIIICLIYGLIRSSQPIQGEELKVAIIPGNIDQQEKLSSWGDKAGWIFDRYVKDTLPVLKEKPDIIVWPETAVPSIIFPESSMKEKLLEVVRSWKTYMLTGAICVDYQIIRSDRMVRKVYNSAVLLSPDAKMVGAYHKIHLVPISESFPFKRYLPKKIHDLVVGVSDFDSGEEYTVFDAGRAKIGVPICFESVFPEISRNFVKNGANVICMITNDAWFWGTFAAEQHFSMAPFRAVENKVSIFRCANYGVSSIIDPYGRVVKTLTPYDDEKSLTGQVLISFGGTYYTRHGDYFAWSCLAFSVFLVFREWFKGYRTGGNVNVSRDAFSNRRRQSSNNRGRGSSLTSQRRKKR